MKYKCIKQLHHLIEKRNERLIQSVAKEKRKDNGEGKVLEMHRKRGATIVRSFVEGDIIRLMKMNHQQIVDYGQRNERLIRIKDAVYLEEHVEYRRAIFEKGRLVEDKTMTPIHYEIDRNEQLIEAKQGVQCTEQRFLYDRLEAVRYAERWWNDYNPVYKQFSVNCTNFVSQCLRAGGGPMTGYPHRQKGWWYQGNNWSFSWSVAHSLRWYLSGAKSGLRGEEKQSAKDLLPGDVICYDFDGNGRWEHSTIVVAHDVNKEPLVNAQTSNSRMRYWTYEDSTAWTPNIKYKFFHIK